MKTIHAERGEYSIRPVDGLADRAAIFIGAAAWFTVGVQIIDRSNAPAVVASPHAASSSWLFIMLWLIGFTLICTRIAWSFFGVTKIFVSSTDVVTKKYLGAVPIYVSRPIELSAITDVLLEEREVYFKGTRRRRWALIVHLNEGAKRRVANFTNGNEASEFMHRYVR
jgi:hypothetical protein